MSEKNGYKYSHKGKLLIKVIGIAIAAVVAISAALTIVGSTTISKTYNTLILEELKATCEHLDSEVSSLNDNGDWDLQDGVLLKGGEPIAEEIEGIIDELRSETGIDYTIFYGDTRILTTIYKKGTKEKLVGTKASDAVIKATLTGGKEYSSDSLNIEGLPYYGYYCPLTNSDGKVVGMVFTGRESTDVSRAISGNVIKMVLIAVIAVAAIAGAGLVIALRTSKQMSDIAGLISNIADGRLGNVFDEKMMMRKDEIGAIAESAKTLDDTLSEIVGNIRESALAVGSSSTELSDMANQISQTAEDVSNAVQEIASGATQQADEIQTASTNVGYIGDAVGDVQTSTNNLESLAGKMKEASEVSSASLSNLQESSGEMTAKIDEISETIQRTQEAVNNISEKVEGITNIATQTNLLSLNASIEAARAGDAGKGFAVVAQEIGKLAEDSKVMADEIRKQMDTLLEQAGAAVVAAGDVKDANLEQQASLGETIQSINGMISDINDTVGGVQTISSGAERCDTSKNAVVDVMSALSAISEENAASSQETGASMQELSATVTTLAGSANGLKDIAEKLNRDMEFFK